MLVMILLLVSYNINIFLKSQKVTNVTPFIDILLKEIYDQSHPKSWEIDQSLGFKKNVKM